MMRRLSAIAPTLFATAVVLATPLHALAETPRVGAEPCMVASVADWVAAPGCFAERPWYGELVDALAADGPAAAKMARELAARHAGDRLVLEAVADWISQDFAPDTELRPLAATSQREAQTWRYTLKEPAGGWFADDFDDSGWQEGRGGFGTRGTPGAIVGTEWRTADIWLRRTFELDASDLADPQLVIHHDEDALVYLNGKKIAEFSGYVTDYFRVPLSKEARGLLRRGRNTLAVYCH